MVVIAKRSENCYNVGMAVLETLPATLKAWLAYYDWTISELSRRSGVRRSALSEAVHGRSGLGMRNLQQVAVALGTTTDALLAGLPPGDAPILAVHPKLATALRRFGALLTDADYSRLAGYLEALAENEAAPARLMDSQE